jgi:adenylylsulfate reductase subunit B
MSILIDRAHCLSCGACVKVCPGSLITLQDNGAHIPRPERCWGCASCVKECAAGAIALFIGEDAGGLGGRLHTQREGPLLCWTVTRADGSSETLTTDSREANKY